MQTKFSASDNNGSISTQLVPSGMEIKTPAGNGSKVLFVIDTLETGGAEKSLFENLRRFRSIDPVVCHIYEGGSLKHLFQNEGIPVYSLGVQKKYGFISAYKKLRQLVRTEQPALIVAYLTRSELISRIYGKINGIPVVGTFVSDLYSKSYNYSLSWKAKAGVFLFKSLNRLTSAFCKGFVANSEAIKNSNSLHLHVPSGKIKVINRGRDSKMFSFQTRELFSSAPVRFLNVGRLVPVKGQLELIEGFRIYLDNNPGSILHIYGSGPSRQRLQNKIRSLGLENSVLLQGTNNNINYLMKAYDCLVFPSHSEGFSGTLVEAMFSGLPILASEIPANRELVQHLKSGYLFSIATPQSIAMALQWFRDNRYTAYLNTLNAYDTAIANFDLDTVSEKFEEHLKSLI